MEKHKIDWLNMPGYKGETWNPIIGCEKVSPACRECYALTMSIRLANIGSTSYYKNVVDGKKWNNETHFVETNIIQPMSWKKPRMVFVCSMSDLFHESNPMQWVNEVLKTISACPQHIFILLTKRPKRAMQILKHLYGTRSVWPAKNIWLGITAENQETANERIPILLEIPAAKRFVSIEPMLGEVKLNQLIREEYGHAWVDNCLTGFNAHGAGGWYANKLDWVIVGGESGHKARPMHPDWVRSIRDQCKEADIPFFFKQYGEWIQVGECGNDDDSKYYHAKNCTRLNLSGNMGYHGEKAIYMMKKGKSKTGSELDGQHHKEFPV